MIFFLTNTVLDIGLGASFWILKQTSYGLYSAYRYLTNNSETRYITNNSESNDTLVILYKEQQDKIEELNNNIDRLTKLVEHKLE
uniref:Uncharacterized protein n=1 Tax=viral metagenome TaxID=1070528 RepID=A0A6C0EI92_9ZZZZ